MTERRTRRAARSRSPSGNTTVSPGNRSVIVSVLFDSGPFSVAAASPAIPEARHCPFFLLSGAMVASSITAKNYSLKGSKTGSSMFWYRVHEQIERGIKSRKGVLNALVVTEPHND